MAKYKLINDSTHKIWYTNNENTKNKLLEEGYHIDNPKAETIKKTTKPRKAVKNVGEDKNTTESDI